MEKNKECPECGFDTIAIVTVSVGNWNYCPVCGNELANSKDRISDNTNKSENKKEQDMKSIPINSESQDLSEKSSKESDNIRDEEDDLDGLTEDSIDIEQEMDRLRDRLESDGEDSDS